MADGEVCIVTPGKENRSHVLARALSISTLEWLAGVCVFSFFPISSPSTVLGDAF